MKAATKRPGTGRPRKSDRLVVPGCSADEIRCDHAVAPFGRAALLMDRKWGISKLTELVSPETADKFGSAMAKMNAAIESADPVETVRRVNVCIRGLAAMDAEAEANGAPKANPEVWIYDLDGWRIGIHPDVSDWPAVSEANPGIELFTLREVAVALRDLRHPLVASVKEHFPGSQITEIRRPSLDEKFFGKGGDPIPF